MSHRWRKQQWENVGLLVGYNDQLRHRLAHSGATDHLISYIFAQTSHPWRRFSQDQRSVTRFFPGSIDGDVDRGSSGRGSTRFQTFFSSQQNRHQNINWTSKTLRANLVMSTEHTFYLVSLIICFVSLIIIFSVITPSHFRIPLNKFPC